MSPSFTLLLDRSAPLIAVVLSSGADPEAIARQVEDEAEKAERKDVAPSLSPDPKAALLTAYDESRQLGASYVGPATYCSRLRATTRTRPASCSLWKDAASTGSTGVRFA